MKYNVLFISTLLILILSCNRTDNSGSLSKKELSRVVLVGGSMISGMEDYGYFEQALIRTNPKEKISLRNIGWPADDVYGLARSQFGSAQNTKSWKPPSAEEGFGSKVLMNHIDEAEPATLFIGYGSEAAFYKSQEEFDLFKNGYERLLDYAEQKNAKLILISPHKQEEVYNPGAEIRNSWLSKAASFIEGQAQKRGHFYINLFDELITDPGNKKYTSDGSQLNKLGYQRMAEILLTNLGMSAKNHFTLTIDENVKILSTKNCETSDWIKTVNGVSFSITPSEMLYAGEIISTNPVAIYINGKLRSNNQDTIARINLIQDSLQQTRMLETIKEKNRLYRYRLRPLNEAYIYLFRKHEMEHLAYEMEDLIRLVEEKEREINRLKRSGTHDVEVELIKVWQPPKDYRENEVPSYLPEPNIAEELKSFEVIEGYEVSLFASDPMIANPININWDTKGRAWVATSSTYPHIVPGREPNDKIIILEDTDLDGVADKHTVFAENLLVPHSVMPVEGGAYVTATTELLFLADTDGDNMADERHVIFDGFGNADVHHTIHGLRWTPWGDLHFMQSIYINSFIETSYGPRILNGSGTWIFRREKEDLNIFNRGLINPWGEAFDKWGQAFATDGAGGSGVNYIFPESAHATAVGARTILEGLNNNKPKNTAAEIIYSKHFPGEWQGSLVANDYRANRTIRYKITDDKSGYHSEEIETILRSDHRSYRPVDSKIGPDGALYIVDWYNPIIAHGEVDFYHPDRDKTHGRIWKLTKKGSPLLPVINMKNRSLSFLLNQLQSTEQFTRLQASRAYVEKNGDPQLVVDWINNLRSSDPHYSHHRLEGLWLLAALNHYEGSVLRSALNSSNPNEKAAAIRLVSHYNKQKDHLDLLRQYIIDKHPRVRLETIHSLREMRGNDAAEIVINVLEKPMDANLEFALSLTLNKLLEDWIDNFENGNNPFDGDQKKQMYALLTSEDARIIPHITRLLKSEQLGDDLVTKGWNLLAKIGDAKTKSSVLTKAIKEENSDLLMIMADAPEVYDGVPGNIQLLESGILHDSMKIRIQALKLASRWRTSQFVDLIAERAERATDRSEKLSALRAMTAVGESSQIIEWAQKSHNDTLKTYACAIWVESDMVEAKNTAVEILSILDDANLGELLFTTFKNLENGPEVLANALKGKIIPENIASAGLNVIQTSGLNLTKLENAIHLAGSITPIGVEMTEEEEAKLIQYAIDSGNKYAGSKIYNNKELMCATCHRIDNQGGLSGPNLSTIGTFMSPDAILEAILNPNSAIKQSYETVVITKTNGEVISGLMDRKTATATLIRQANNQVVEVPNAEIANTDTSPNSLMPIGLTRNLRLDELRDLMAYMMSLGVED